MSDAMISDVMQKTANDLQARYGSSYKIDVKPKTIVITPTSKSGPIDLKEGFRRSEHAKQRIDKYGTPISGSWYLVVPIRRTLRSFHSKTRAQKDLQSIEPTKTKAIDYLFDGPKGRKYNVFNPNIRTRSNNLTRSARDKNNRTTYAALRTVSDKSPKNSWILNREIDRNVVLNDLRTIAEKHLKSIVGN